MPSTKILPYHRNLFRLRREVDAIHRSTRSELAGGLAYGLDAPTFAAALPEHYRAWVRARRQLAQEAIALRSAGLYPVSAAK